MLEEVDSTKNEHLCSYRKICTNFKKTSPKTEKCKQFCLRNPLVTLSTDLFVNIDPTKNIQVKNEIVDMVYDLKNKRKELQESMDHLVKLIDNNASKQEIIDQRNFIKKKELEYVMAENKRIHLKPTVDHSSFLIEKNDLESLEKQRKAIEQKEKEIIHVTQSKMRGENTKIISDRFKNQDIEVNQKKSVKSLIAAVVKLNKPIAESKSDVVKRQKATKENQV
jgi:hypothetical protein